MINEKSLKIYTDGGARGNPGPAAVGIYILGESGNEILKLGKRIGEATNNVAEYSAVIIALEWVIENSNLKNLLQINFFLDSSLVVNQLNGKFKIKESHLRDLVITIKKLEKHFSCNFTFQHLNRESNYVADSIVNSCF